MSNNSARVLPTNKKFFRPSAALRSARSGGEAATIYYSLIETAKVNQIEPSQCLLNAMRELPKRKSSSFSDVKDLLPINGAELP
jgi:hypothetical protein